MQGGGKLFLVIVCLYPHNRQGKGNLLLEENHHIQTTVKDRNIVRVYHLNERNNELDEWENAHKIPHTAYFYWCL